MDEVYVPVNVKEPGGRMMAKLFILNLINFHKELPTNHICHSLFHTPIYGDMDSQVPWLLTNQLLSEMEKMVWIRMTPKLTWEINAELFME